LLAGEYAVLAGAPGIVCAVERHLTCEADAAARFSIEGAGARWDEGGEVGTLGFAHEALRAARDYLEGRGRTLAPLALKIHDELRAPDGKKLGLGGSACTCVAVVSAAFASAGQPLDKPLVFKLAATAHASAQKKQGSALDVAAATYGGVLFTWRFEAEPLVAAWKAGPKAFAMAVDRTEAPTVERLREPLALLLVFSGKSASTPSLMAQIERWAVKEPKGWAEFIAYSSAACDRLRKALASRDDEAMREAVEAAGEQLQVLGDRSGTPVVTEEHRIVARTARKLGTAAKVSGAGGGDSCVALGRPEAIDSLGAELRDAGMLALRLAVDGDGARLG
jgi:phosphomevalonate kinase